MIRRERYLSWENDPTVSLEAYLPEKGENMPAIIVLPGGGYHALSETEGGEVAQYFAQRGFAAFLLRYSTMYSDFSQSGGEKNLHTLFPEPLHELAAAIKLIRGKSAEFNINPNGIALMGFSAGGHLAANYCNEWNTPEMTSAVDAEAEEICPNVCILCYAATRLRRTSLSMNTAVFGDRESLDADDLLRWCAAENVGRDNPPTMLWHSVTDRMVPVSQSFEMAQALYDEGIPCELHIFSQGDHATGLAEGMPHRKWKELAIDFIERHI